MTTYDETYELTTRYDAHASFYGKARVEIEGTTRRLFSYETHVASIKDCGDGLGLRPMVFDTYSTTTLRHIKEFLLQNGFKAINKAQIIKDYGEDAQQ